jgi:hypothetical protein
LNTFHQKLHFIVSRLLIVFFFTILIIHSSREIVDLDLWLHIKTGELIFQTGQVPLRDIFSFTLNQKEWINHEWLFQLTTYLSYHLAGIDGLIVMQNLVLIALFLLLFLIGIDARRNNHVFVFVVLYMTLLTINYRFTIRPDIFSLFFLTLTMGLLKEYADFPDSRNIWLLPVSQVIWVNMHGFAFIGPLVVLIFLAGELIKRTVRLPWEWKNTKRFDNHQLTRLIIVFGLMLLAFFANPQGSKGALYPFSVLGQISGEGKIIFTHIMELAKPITPKSLLDVRSFLFFKCFILLVLFSFRFNGRRLNISDAIAFALFLFFALSAIRNIAYFGVVGACIIFNNVQIALDNKKQFPFGNIPARAKTLAYYGFIVFLFIYTAKGANKYLEEGSYNFDTYELKSSMWSMAPNRFPVKAADFLLENDFPKRMLNDFNSGAYLVGRGYPQRQVFMDGRTELYGPAFFKQYVALGQGKKDVVEDIIDRYKIEGAFFTSSAYDLHGGLMRYFDQNPQWSPVYFDQGGIIFLKKDKANLELLKKFAFNLEDWKATAPDYMKLGLRSRYPRPFLQRARLLNYLLHYKAAADEARIALNIMPHNAEAFHFMSDYYFEQKDYPEAYQYARKCLLFDGADSTMRARLGLIYFYLGEKEKAFKLINEMIKKLPKAAEPLYVKARMIEADDLKLACSLASRASALAPKEPRYHLQRGDLLKKTGDNQGAREEWLKAYEYDSQNKEIKQRLQD